MVSFIRKSDITDSRDPFIDVDEIYKAAITTPRFNPITSFCNAFKDDDKSSFWEDLTLNDVQTVVNQTNIQAKLSKSQLNNLDRNGYRKRKV